MHARFDTIRRIVDINIVGPTILTRAAIKRMLVQGGGNIWSVSSICGSRGYAGLTVYAGSKGYLDAMMRALAREVGEARISSTAWPPDSSNRRCRRSYSQTAADDQASYAVGFACSNDENIFKVVDLVISGVTNMNGQVVFVDGGITS